MDNIKIYILNLFDDVRQFSSDLVLFTSKKMRVSFFHFEVGKGKFVSTLYRKRGRHTRTFIHSGMATLAAFGVMIAPAIAQEFPGRSVNPWEIQSPSTVLSATAENSSTSTLVSEKMRDQVVEYEVQEGDTVSTIAEKFDISADTLRWQNDLSLKARIKVGQTLEILPVTGISHKVQKGDTVYSIAKRYDSSAQAIVDFPYNTFTNDETFELAIGQLIVVPDGVKPKARRGAPRIRQLTPDAGTVVASGNFVWPTSGRITQRWFWYHKGIDIANKKAPGVLAADSGTVVVAGWIDGYGYGSRIVIDHGNGYKTRYAHLSRINVQVGQTVNRGDLIAIMGSTGRSTGTHLHFEIIRNGVHLNPLSILR